jgi:hypothetical protein
MENFRAEPSPIEPNRPARIGMTWIATLVEFCLGTAILFNAPKYVLEGPQNYALGLLVGSLCLAALAGFFFWVKRSQPRFAGWMFLGLVVLVGGAIYWTTRFGVSGVVVSLPIVLPLLVFVMVSHIKVLITPFRRGN